LVLRAADLALCHLEVPLDPTSRKVSGFPVFSAPREIASALAGAGFDGCSTASNHSLDRGVSGLFETLDVLDEEGLGHAGTARTAEDPVGWIYDLGGLRVGHLSYSYGVQHSGRARNTPWVANQIDTEKIVADAVVLRSEGANFVVVSLHWGAEFSSKPNGRQRSQADELMSAPEIDLIVGHHPHVLQPVTMVGDKPVLYSLGNFLSNQTAPCCPANSEEGVIVLLRVDAAGEGWEVSEIVHVPTWVDRRHGHVVTPALGDEAEASRHAGRLRTAADRTRATLGAAGEGLSPQDAYLWVREVTPSPWERVAAAVGAGPAAIAPASWHLRAFGALTRGSRFG
jgi:poly-gamma-glutamate synthesis protein (capsule biosynthesis protein)